VPSLSVRRNRGGDREAPWPAQESSGSHYGALNFDLILPTRSRRYKELILQTYIEGNSRGRVGNGSAVGSVLGGGEDNLQWCSSFKGVCQSFLVLPSRFLSGQLLQTVAENSNLVAT
jgi:hypothetical protein